MGRSWVGQIGPVSQVLPDLTGPLHYAVGSYTNWAIVAASR